MNQPISGGCACGGVRYECSAEPLMAVNCHCRDCQRATGTAYASGLLVPEAALRLVKGAPKYHTSTADSGHRVKRGFCPECGSPVLAQNEAYPMFIIAAASLDDPSGHRPMMDVWTESAQPWDHMNPELAKYPKGLEQAS